jgi:hypothetical protein
MYPVEGAWQNGQNFGTGRMSKGDAQLQNVLKKKKIYISVSLYDTLTKTTVVATR